MLGLGSSHFAYGRATGEGRPVKVREPATYRQSYCIGVGLDPELGVCG